MNATQKEKFNTILPQITRHVTDIRHDLHQHPELGYEERYTSALVKGELTRLGISYVDNLAGGTGVVGLIQGGHDGPCIGLRADMDALPIEEMTGLPYASLTPGKMHACGHDGHTSVLLGTAAALKEIAADLHGHIKLIFQPAEEGAMGGERMVEDGVLLNVGGPPIDAIFGLHGWPGLKVGQAGTRPGPLLASVDGFRVVIKGQGTHAAAPQNGVDPIVAGAAIVQALQTVIAREVDPADAAVLTVAQFHAGSTFNVIPESAEIVGTIRALTPARRQQVLASFQRITAGVAQSLRCSAEIELFGATPSTFNTPAEAEFVRNVVTQSLGADAFVPMPVPAMWGEDFAFYLQHVPGCFYVLGVCPHDRENYPMLHNPHFNFTDEAIPYGIRLMAEIACEKLRAR